MRRARARSAAWPWSRSYPQAGEDVADEELRDMSRRLLVSAILTFPLFVIAMADLMFRAPAVAEFVQSSYATVGGVTARDPRGDLGWLAISRAGLAVRHQSASQYVHAHRARYDLGLFL